jgi:hypothetical protein
MMWTAFAGARIGGSRPSRFAAQGCRRPTSSIDTQTALR